MNMPTTINAIDLEEIHAFLAVNHKLGGDHFNAQMLRAWAAARDAGAAAEEHDFE